MDKDKLLNAVTGIREKIEENQSKEAMTEIAIVLETLINELDETKTMAKTCSAIIGGMLGGYS